MNLSTALLLLVAWQMLGNKSNDRQQTPPPDLKSFLSDDTRTLMDSIGKLSSTTATSDEKTGALLGLVTNPTVMSLAESFLGGQKPLVNDEGYNLGTPSKESQEFFKPVDTIADAEVKSKLYKWYDWNIAGK